MTIDSVSGNSGTAAAQQQRETSKNEEARAEETTERREAEANQTRENARADEERTKKLADA